MGNMKPTKADHKQLYSDIENWLKVHDQIDLEEANAKLLNVAGLCVSLIRAPVEVPPEIEDILSVIYGMIDGEKYYRGDDIIPEMTQRKKMSNMSKEEIFAKIRKLCEMSESFAKLLTKQMTDPEELGNVALIKHIMGNAIYHHSRHMSKFFIAIRCLEDLQEKGDKDETN